MTYDQLYEHIIHYVAMPHTTITENDHRRTCLIFGAFMEFILDCQDEGVDVNKIDVTDVMSKKLKDALGGK